MYTFAGIILVNGYLPDDQLDGCSERHDLTPSRGH